jgi:hypothetical protein
MAKQQKRAKQELESLIPAIKVEEKRLEDLLGDARVQAEAIVRSAQTGADELIESTRKALPGILQAEREARRAALVRRAEEAAGAEAERTRALERTGRESMKTTVSYIVSLVWPGAPSPPQARNTREKGTQ